SNVIDCVAVITQLVIGKQFIIHMSRYNAFRVSSAVYHIPVAPPGTIQVEFNNSDELTLFSIDGFFPVENKVAWEPFSLLPENLEHLFKQQLKLIDIPLEEEERWLPIYGIDEIYVRNQGEQRSEERRVGKECVD